MSKALNFVLWGAAACSGAVLVIGMVGLSIINGGV